MSTEEEKKFRAQVAIQKANQYAELAIDDRFVLWKTEQVEATLKRMVDDVMNAKPMEVFNGTPMYDPYWKDKIAAGVLAYQDFKKAHVDSFKIIEHAANTAKERLKQQKQGESHA